MGILCAAIALIVGAALAISSGDPRGLIVLALGAVGGWAAGRGLASEPAAAPAREASPAAPVAPAALTQPARSQTTVPTEQPSPATTATDPVTELVSPGPADDAATLTGPGAAKRVLAAEAERLRAPEPAVVPESPPVREPVPAVVSVGREPVAASERGTALPGRVADADSAPAGEASASGLEAPPRPRPPDDPAAGQEALDVGTPLPTEARLHDLAARQRSSTADLRRSIRDVIERLDDEEPPPARRRGKKPRR